jgi:hypothetical protein
VWLWMWRNGRRRLVMAREADVVDGAEGVADVVREKRRSTMIRRTCSQTFEAEGEVAGGT